MSITRTVFIEVGDPDHLDEVRTAIVESLNQNAVVQKVAGSGPSIRLRVQFTNEEQMQSAIQAARRSALHLTAAYDVD